MELYDTLDGFLRSCPDNGVNFEIQSAFLKAWSKIHGWNGDGKPWTMYPVILTAISGGADSDVTLDMIERIGHPLSEVHYVFYDSGLEFEATKRHLDFLEQKYGVSIERRKAKIPVPLGVKRFGVPFLSKKAGDYSHRLQKTPMMRRSPRSDISAPISEARERISEVRGLPTTATVSIPRNLSRNYKRLWTACAKAAR